MKRFITNFINDEGGQDLVEYALLLSILAVAGIATLGTLATTVAGAFTTVNGKISAS
jgi:pilus assembly protein Flp/PilA